jgi:hypothetical protein
VNGARAAPPRWVGRLLSPYLSQVVSKGRLESIVLVGGNAVVISEIILTYLTIGTNLTSKIALVGGILMTNKANIGVTLNDITNITANTVVHINSLVNNVLSTSGNDYNIIAIRKLPSLTVLCIVHSKSLVVKLRLAKFVLSLDLNILSHKVVDLLGGFFQEVAPLKVVSQSPKAISTLILPHLTSYKVIDTHSKSFS